MVKESNEFVKIIIKNPDKTIIDCLNHYIRTVDVKSLDIITQNYELFFKIGETLRNSDNSIIDEMKKGI